LNGLGHVREVILVKDDPPTIRSALDELDEYARWEFGLEEATFDYPRPEDGAKSRARRPPREAARPATQRKFHCVRIGAITSKRGINTIV
jgi:hypothetical protein